MGYNTKIVLGGIGHEQDDNFVAFPSGSFCITHGLETGNAPISGSIYENRKTF